jgi:chaperonin GroEL
MGYDARSVAFVDLMAADMIDPTQVTRSALQNAASVAGLLLTTEVLITALPEKPQAFPSKEALLSRGCSFEFLPA